MASEWPAAGVSGAGSAPLFPRHHRQWLLGRLSADCDNQRQICLNSLLQQQQQRRRQQRQH